jgi:hypothetical protein
MRRSTHDCRRWRQHGRITPSSLTYRSSSGCKTQVQFRFHREEPTARPRGASLPKDKGVRKPKLVPRNVPMIVSIEWLSS